MALRDLLDEEQWRARIALAIMLLAFGGLLYVLWQKQVAHGATYEQGLERQSVRRVRTPGVRGRLYDRQGRCLADNRPGYTISLYLEELRRPGRWSNTIQRVEGLLDELSVRLGLPRQVTRDEIWSHIRFRLPLPMPAWRDVNEEVLARLAEQGMDVGGVDISVEPVREYPYGAMACHVLGYIGRADPPRGEEEAFHFYIPEMVGRAGLEKRYDDVLRGRAGGRLVLVDVSGYRFKDLGEQKAAAGHDLMLTLSVEAQQAMEKALDGHVGAGVIVDPASGDVLAMASTPGFDPNRFSPVLPPEEWRRMMDDERRPMLNRAMAANYSPGSTFKPVVALAALQSGAAGAHTTFNCPGYFQLGRATFACWYSPGHGPTDLRQSLERSCNVYYFNLGLLCGYDAIYHMAAALGLGRRTGIDLEGEFGGLLPDDAWKRRTQRDAWRDGDTCNISIGQGALMATPLQMALLTATIANGGTLWKPRLVRGRREPGAKSFELVPPEKANALHWKPDAIRLVRAGMTDVVMSPTGTGRYAKIPGVSVAGKTGTAEYGRKGEGLKLAWMVAWAPAEKPRYAIALVVEEGDTGGRTTAPLMKIVLENLFPEASAPAG